MNGRATHRRRGSIYVLVLGCAMIVTVIGLSALTVIRIERRFAENTGNFAQARFCAQSAIEMGLLRIDQNANWRTTYPNGVWEANRPIGTGTYTLQGIDPDDADLTDRNTDPVVLTGIGVQGEARYKLQVTLVAVLDPLEALRTAIHAGSIVVKGGKSLTVNGAPASTNGLLQLDGGAQILGDIEAASLSNGGTIVGTITVPAAPKIMPAAYVFADYVAKATPLPFTGNLTNQVLSPGYNPWGSPNPDGVYYLDTAGNSLKIQSSRINGTLIVSCPGMTLTIEKASLLHAYREDYPVLIVDGNVEISLMSTTATLDESTAGNLNPPGAPYLGQSDTDTTDQYPTEIQGLVHIKGTLKFATEASRVRGVVICEGGVTVDNAPEIIHNPALYTNPPQGYTVLKMMKIADGTWRQNVD